MDELTRLAERFEQQRPRLLAMAYRMLGSRSEAEDAVQEAWLRLSTTAHGELDNLFGWLTTVVGRISLNVLRSRKVRSATYVPDPILDPAEGMTPEHATLLAGSLGLALLVVLETLAPTERIAFVLHDVFGLPFDEIAPIVERTPDATRQLASRARRRIEVRGTTSDVDSQLQRNLVSAFAAAAHEGDFDSLIALLASDVVLRVDGGMLTNSSLELRGAEQVARRAQAFTRTGLLRRPVLVNGQPGIVCVLGGKAFSVMAFTVRAERIAAIHVLRDPQRVNGVDLSALEAR
jgi:RNA polymerase sigma-70 factor (ECF subfamily)